MATSYTIASRDTLSKIARQHYGDAKFAGVIADFNGLPDANQIMVGQRLWLPSARDLKTAPVAAANTAAPAWPSPPHGFQAVRDTFGDLLAYVRDDGTLDPKWESERLAKVRLPFAMPLSWDTSQSATSIRCHKLLAPLFAEVFAQIVAQGLTDAIKTYGGCYQYRPKRAGLNPSTHSWGIAIDLNPNTNAMGTAGDMDPGLIELFESFGFLWGGRWAGRGKDPMHFQYCTGY